MSRIIKLSEEIKVTVINITTGSKNALLLVLDFNFDRAGWLTGFLDILGQAYAACALFNIGIFMVGKLKKLTGTVILVATLLIVAKTYVCMYMYTLILCMK